MPKHTVKQGENLTRIAKKYGFADYKVIYEHPTNEAFREKRPDPNVLFPGDVINVPEKKVDKKTGRSGGKHKFKLKPPVAERLVIKIQDGDDDPWVGIKVVLDVEGKTLETEIGDDGLLELNVPDGASRGTLKVFMEPESNEHTHEYALELGNLDPVEELSGVQARCNALGFDCGVADGIMGKNTKKGVKEFQSAYDLDVDGIPGPLTQGKLKEVYGG